MEILEQKIVWHDGKEPSEKGEKLIYYKRDGIATILNFDKPLDGKFASYGIIAWAYIDTSVIKTAIANKNIDTSWLEFLHNNATNIK